MQWFISTPINSFTSCLRFCFSLVQPTLLYGVIIGAKWKCLIQVMSLLNLPVLFIHFLPLHSIFRLFISLDCWVTYFPPKLTFGHLLSFWSTSWSKLTSQRSFFLSLTYDIPFIYISYKYFMHNKTIGIVLNLDLPF